MSEVATQTKERISDKVVLLVISIGLVGIILAIINVIHQAASADKVLPNWAENVFVAIATAAILKLGDCLSTLVALTSGRQVERLGTKLADSQPANLTDPNTPAGTIEDPAAVVVVNPPEAPAQVEQVPDEPPARRRAK